MSVDVAVVGQQAQLERTKLHVHHGGVLMLVVVADTGGGEEPYADATAAEFSGWPQLTHNIKSDQLEKPAFFKNVG